MNSKAMSLIKLVGNEGSRNKKKKILYVIYSNIAQYIRPYNIGYNLNNDKCYKNKAGIRRKDK